MARFAIIEKEIEIRVYMKNQAWRLKEWNTDITSSLSYRFVKTFKNHSKIKPMHKHLSFFFAKERTCTCILINPFGRTLFCGRDLCSVGMSWRRRVEEPSLSDDDQGWSGTAAGWTASCFSWNGRSSGTVAGRTSWKRCSSGTEAGWTSSCLSWKGWPARRGLGTAFVLQPLKQSP
jgi:hypothetical protein